MKQLCSFVLLALVCYFCGKYMIYFSALLLVASYWCLRVLVVPSNAASLYAYTQQDVWYGSSSCNQSLYSHSIISATSCVSSPTFNRSTSVLFYNETNIILVQISRFNATGCNDSLISAVNYTQNACEITTVPVNGSVNTTGVSVAGLPDYNFPYAQLISVFPGANCGTPGTAAAAFTLFSPECRNTTIPGEGSPPSFSISSFSFYNDHRRSNKCCKGVQRHASL